MSQVAGKAACAGEYGVQVQVKVKGGKRIVCLATVRRAPDGTRFWLANFNDNQKAKLKYNPQITIHPEDVESVCVYLRAASASIEQGTTVQDGWEAAEQFTRPMYQGDASPTRDPPPF